MLQSVKHDTQSSGKLDVFPCFHKVAGRKVIIVGGYEEAAAKVRLLGETSAEIVIITPEIDEAMERAIEETGATHIARDFAFDDFIGAALVFTAQETEEADAMAVEAARLVGAPVNAVDRPHLCDFITPAIVNRAPVAVAISTNGTAPVLSRRLKAAVEQLLPSRTGALALFADAFRPPVAKSGRDSRQRRLFWESFFDGAPAQAALEGKMGTACQAARDLLTSGEDAKGLVSIVGAGPGEEDLLTLRAHHLLQNADVIFHDAPVSRQIISMGRRDAEIISVGTHNHALIAERAKAGLKVVWLKSGEAALAGCVVDQAATLNIAGVNYEIVPGVSSVRPIENQTTATSSQIRLGEVA